MAKGPSRFNSVTLLLILVFAAGGYWVWKFFPHYFRAWQVDHILADGASQSYKISRMTEPLQSRSRTELVETMRTKINALGIEDPDLAVGLDFQGELVTVTADYSVQVNHPVADKVTIMSMHRVANGDLKKVVWDN